MLAFTVLWQKFLVVLLFPLVICIIAWAEYQAGVMTRKPKDKRNKRVTKARRKFEKSVGR